MQWMLSPDGSVRRRRVHLVGPAESGQVTAVVRYDSGARFPAHDHPDGEEILVLEGVFSDEHGDWPAGTYLLNPEGFRHAPFSRLGCTLFVKLRQYSGPGRAHVATDTSKLSWQSGPDPGVKVKPLYRQAGFADTVRLERWAPRTQRDSVTYPAGAEMYVLNGRFEDEMGCYGTATWLRFPADAVHAPVCDRGCELYVKEGGLRYLKQA
jgi:anti-sigma factor ChrR (cupin superfamily)